MAPKGTRGKTRLCTVTEVGSGTRHFRYHAKVGMFEQESSFWGQPAPGRLTALTVAPHTQENTKHTHAAIEKQINGVIVGEL